MTSIEEADGWIGRTALDDGGEQIGLISQIWVDDATGHPAWASVQGAILRNREALVPLAGNVALGSGRQFAYTKEEIVKAPQVAQDGRLSVEEMELLSMHYGAPAEGGPPSRPESWADRMDDLAEGETAPVPAGPPAAGTKPKRLRRKAGGPEQKATRRFGRKRTAPDQAATSQPIEPDEVPVGG